MIDVGLSVLMTVALLVLSDDQRRIASERIREALRLSNIALSEAAYFMRLDPADLTRGLSGERKLDYWRLQGLPEIFWQHYHYLGALAHGLPEHVRRAVKMGLPEAVEQKRKVQ